MILELIDRAHYEITMQLVYHEGGIYEQLHLEEALTCLDQAIVQLRYAELAGKEGR